MNDELKNKFKNGMIPDEIAFGQLIDEATKETDLSGYATKEEIPVVPDVSQFITLEDIPETDLSSYAKVSDIPSLDGLLNQTDAETLYVRKDVLPNFEEYAKKTDIPAPQDLSHLATKEEIPDVSSFITLEEIPPTDLSDYAKVSDIPSLSGLLSESNAETLYVKKSELPDFNSFIKRPATPLPEEATSTFVAEMNRKALEIGVKTGRFKNPSGLSEAGKVQTAQDMSLILRNAVFYPDILKVWGKRNYSINITENSRVFDINTTLDYQIMGSDFVILGGKTGTIGIVRNFIGIVKHVPTGKLIGVTIIRADDDRFVAAKELVLESIKVIDGETPDLNSITAQYAHSFEVTPDMSLGGAGTINKTLIEKNSSTTQSPASTTKILTSMILLDNIESLGERIHFKESDVVAGSPVFREGESVTAEDALHLLLLPSSNTVANAVARHVGEKIIQRKSTQ